MEDSVYHVDISRGEFDDQQAFYATVTGPGLPAQGDHRMAENLWLLCTDITLAIQEANPRFTAPFRLIPPPRYKQRGRWWQFWKPQRSELFGRA